MGAHPHRVRLWTFILATLAAGASCAHDGTGGAIVRHQRVYVETLPGGSIHAAEFLDTGDAPPLLAIERIDACSSERVKILSAERAAQVAEAVRGGTALEQALPPSLRRRQPSWKEALPPGRSLSGLRVEVVVVEDDLGLHRAIRIVDAEGRAAELARAPADAEIALARMPGGPHDRALARIDGPGAVRDLRVLDLAGGARALHVARGEASLAAGDVAGAIAAADVGARFDRQSCAPTGAADWLRARALAIGGAPVAQVIDALERAIAIHPSLYRMYARTAPEMEALRKDPRFAERIAPRPLP